MTRGINKLDVPPISRDKLPGDVLAELAPLDVALAANPKDQAALVSEAAVFENHKLVPNALEVYYKLREQWPDAGWIKGKVFALEEALALQPAPTTPASPRRTPYALLLVTSHHTT